MAMHMRIIMYDRAQQQGGGGFGAIKGKRGWMEAKQYTDGVVFDTSYSPRLCCRCLIARVAFFIFHGAAWGVLCQVVASPLDFSRRNFQPFTTTHTY